MDYNVFYNNRFYYNSKAKKKYNWKQRLLLRSYNKLFIVLSPCHWIWIENSKSKKYLSLPTSHPHLIYHNTPIHLFSIFEFSEILNTNNYYAIFYICFLYYLYLCYLSSLLILAIFLILSLSYFSSYYWSIFL